MRKYILISLINCFLPSLLLSPAFHGHFAIFLHSLRKYHITGSPINLFPKSRSILLSPQQWVCVHDQVQGLISDCPRTRTSTLHKELIFFVLLVTFLVVVVVVKGVRGREEPGITFSKVCPYELLVHLHFRLLILP